MRRRERKSKNINGVDVFKGLWVSPIRKDVAKQQSLVQKNPINQNKTLVLQCNNNVITL
jgi:hypothetical protein